MLFFPGGRVARAAVGAEEAARIGAGFGRVTAAAKAGAKEFTPRALTVRGVTQQVPGKAGSRITRAVIERPADVVSTHISTSERRTARVIRRAERYRFVPKASAEARIIRHGGDQIPFEAGLKHAAAEQHVAALPVEHSASDIAHSHYAALPASHRNVATLGRIRANWRHPRARAVRRGGRRSGQGVEEGAGRKAEPRAGGGGRRRQGRGSEGEKALRYNSSRIEHLQLAIADHKPGGRLADDLNLAIHKITHAIEAKVPVRTRR